MWLGYRSLRSNENLHAGIGLISNADKVAKLLHPIWNASLDEKYPVLMQIIRHFKPAQVNPSRPSPSIHRSSPRKAFSRSSEPPKDIENVLSASSIDGEACAKGASSGCFGGISTEQIWTPHCTYSQQGIFFPETGVVDHDLAMGELSMPSQYTTEQQNPALPHAFFQPQGLTPFQNFPEPQSFHQPQGLMIPQTFMNAGVSQTVPMLQSSIPPFMFQDVDFWQPIANKNLDFGFGQ